ncbi:microfibrillar-associated protein 1-like protein [Tanacetum coccineum]
MAMMKPVFVKKSERDTIAEREKMEAEERAIKEFMKMRVEERKVETKQMVVEVVRKDMEIQKNKETEGEVDTDDDENIFEAWIPREAARIKRDREVRDAMVQEKEEIERVRNMTEEERKEWDRKNPKPHGAPKQKRKYMQRYYHRGAFFQDKPDDTAGTTGADGILQRDYSAPTGEDKMDRTSYSVIAPQLAKDDGVFDDTVFATESERDTIDEGENNDAEKRTTKEVMKTNCEEWKVETPKEIIVEEISEEYETWRLREIVRSKRDREERNIMVKEKERMMI